MKKVKVSIISSDEIRLDEDASKGDIINLKEEQMLILLLLAN